MKFHSAIYRIPWLHLHWDQIFWGINSAADTWFPCRAGLWQQAQETTESEPCKWLLYELEVSIIYESMDFTLKLIYFFEQWLLQFKFANRQLSWRSPFLGCSLSYHFPRHVLYCNSTSVILRTVFQSSVGALLQTEFSLFSVLLSLSNQEDYHWNSKYYLLKEVKT